MAYKLGEGSGAGQPRMRSLVHRRHSLRTPGEVHLSPEGIALARKVGAGSGRFDRVLTSPILRAVETAEAMGYRVDERWESLGALAEPVGRFLDRERPSSFGEYVRWSTTVHEVRDAARQLARTWGEALDRLPDRSRVLMVSHAGVIELGAAGALPEAALQWGASLAPLEGVRLDRERGRWVRGEVLRVPG
jgi:broad specificity phosphatase PhoE